MEDYEIHQKGEDMGLDFTDYLQLMVQQLQNQTMDNTQILRICSISWYRCRWCR